MLPKEKKVELNSEKDIFSQNFIFLNVFKAHRFYHSILKEHF